jgi:ketosteroid isomerase-like protein
MDGDSSNEARAIGFFSAMVAQDRDGLSNCFADDIVLWVPKTAAAHNPRPAVGRDAAVKIFIGGGEQRIRAGSAEWTHEHTIAVGDLVAVHSTLRCVTTAGRDYENHYFWLFRFENGRIAEIWEHLDTLYALTNFDDFGAIFQCIRESGTGVSAATTSSA